ncbi:MAG: hypothetical protein ACD_67C00157G0001, partial [uncultured bacterium]
MFFQKKKEKTQTKPSTDGIYSYRNLNRVQEEIKKVEIVEPTKISVALKKLELKFQSLKISVKKIVEKIKNIPDCHSERSSQQTEKPKNLRSLAIRFLDFARNDRNKKLKNFSQKSKTFLIDHFHLLFKSSAENHLRIQKCKKIKEGESCNLQFNSYSELKRYQKKVRVLTFSTSSIFSIALVAIVSMQIFLSSTSQGATFQFQQTNWSTQSANTAVHPGDKTGWNKYESKDASISLVNGGADVQLLRTDANKTETTEVDFADGTSNPADSTKTIGTGDASLLQINDSLGATKQIATGGGNTCALKTDGTVYCWGNNNMGQLGDGTLLDRKLPLKVLGVGGVGFLSDVSQITAAGNVTCAL